MLKHPRQYFGGILVVEDDPNIQNMIHMALKEWGYKNVFLANGGLEAVSILETYEEEVSIILLDLVMPGMDGVALMRHLVNVHHIPVAVVVQTGHTERLSREAFFALGTETILASEYITKPFKPSRLLEEVEKAFICVDKKRKALQREAEARLHSRLERIESTLETVEKNQQGLLHEVEKNQHGLLYELGRELVKAVVLAIALLALLYLGVGDFVKMVFPSEKSSSASTPPTATELPR